ncbi:hypothetical protein [Sphingobacterium spiritivorum]|uniref:hypothetical protein n=1 Tax=Sphingobacterium spiritivorum TaxID=258 RepID=UPI003DA2A4DB
MKITFKLNRRQLLIWLNSIDLAIGSGLLSDNTLSKMFAANLLSLNQHLTMASVIVKQKYSVKANVSDCLAFQFLTETMILPLSETDQVVINQIVGIIDQKTA